MECAVLVKNLDTWKFPISPIVDLVLEQTLSTMVDENFIDILIMKS